MQKTWLVLKNEFIQAVARRSFILTLVLIPLIGFVITLAVANLQKNSSGGSNPINEIISPSVLPSVEGFVDSSGLVKFIPQSLARRLKAFPSEQEAQQGLRIGEITAYYLIAPDYLQSGKVTYVRPDFNPLGGLSQSGVINELLENNLLDRDLGLVDRLQNPMNLETISLTQQPARDPGNALTFFLPYIVTMFFYIIILTSASLLLSSISNEKESRVMEILMTSVTPMQMLTGKIIALGLAGLMQTIFWSGSGLLLLRLSGASFNVPIAFQLPASILVWGVIFFLLGYALYGSLMAGLGALVPNLREASQATTVIILPLIVPLMVISSLVSDPNGTLAIALSLFPLTSPVTMMTRLAAGQIPFWQPALAAALLVASAFLVVRAVAGMFRAQNLLSGQSFRLNVFFKELIGR
ncbi:MAG TPA: ABC transporter permease [Anaerolineaceae bacterium]|nr:ABC transporter permease [Anaerolineaceae bacterium]